jgi:hypothetical protein
MFSSCFGGRSGRDRQGEREPLLPQHNRQSRCEDAEDLDETSRQAKLHAKMHTYLMLRAISKGYMPSNDQLLAHLNNLVQSLSALAAPSMTSQLSNSGLELVRNLHLWLQQLVKVLEKKNDGNQIQDFIWYLLHARLNVHGANGKAPSPSDIVIKTKSDATAAYQSMQTITSLLLANADFRLLLSDLDTIGRQVLRDTTASLETASHRATQQLDPSKDDLPLNASGRKEGDPKPPTNEDLKEEVRQVSSIVTENAADVAVAAENSISEHVVEDKEQRSAIVNRLKQAVARLCKRPDYAESVSMLSLLLRQYLVQYAHAASDTLQAVEDRVETNESADRAFKNFWQLVTSLGDGEAWALVEKDFHAAVEEATASADFDELAEQICTLVQETLSDPSFFDDAEEPLRRFKKQLDRLSTHSTLADHLSSFITHLQKALRSAAHDAEIQNLVKTSRRLAEVLFPSDSTFNRDLIADSIHIFLPTIISSIQYIPIPRLELTSPAIDLLAENLILQPGKTVNHSSFLPFKFNASTFNDIEVRKGNVRTSSTVTSIVKLKLSGLSIAADDLGFWMRLHSGLLRFSDQGLADFHLDERGMDITLDVEIGQNRLEKIVSLRDVHVKIHHLNYRLGKSKFACIAWLFKPFIRLLAKRALEAKISGAIAQALHAVNRELVYGRERLRAVRVANPSDLWTFLKAVASRLKPPANPDIDSRVGFQPSEGVFRGRYAPGSLVKVWESEGRDAQQHVYEYEQGGWRNEIFDMASTN